MTQISKVQKPAGLRKADDDEVVECIAIDGQYIDLRSVSPVLRAYYHAVSRRVARHESAKAELQAIGQQILAEQAVKRAAAVHGHDAVAKLMGFKK